MKTILFLALVATLALFLTFPFVLRGYHGDDFQFHFATWMGLRQAWLQGEFAPGWDGLANFTFGDPRFCFYPPISLWLGTLLTLVLPPLLAPAAFVWFALAISGVCMMAASKSLVGTRNKYFAALWYMVSPYVLVTGITRFAVAELLVLAWLPLIVLYFVRAMGSSGGRPTMLLGSLLALTWLTNIPAAIVIGYVLLFSAVIASVCQPSVLPVFRFLAAESIAILASAFYLVPAFVEKKWITTDALLHQDFRDYFVFGPLSRLHRVHFGLGFWVISCVQFAVVAGCLMVRGQKAIRSSRTLFGIAAIAFFFQLPLTTLLWVHLPELRFVQFPFRFLAIVGVVLPLVVLGSEIKPWAVKAACGTTVALAMFPLIFYLRIAPSGPSDLSSYLATLQRGYPGTEEYAPTGSTLLSSPVAPVPVSAISDPPGSRCSVSSLPSGPRTRLISVISDSSCRVRLPIYFYPYWEAIDEAGRKLVTSRDDAGMLLVEVPTGSHTVRVRFHAYSLVRIVSLVASFGVFLYFAMAMMRFARRNSLKSHGETQSALGEEGDRSGVPVAEAMP